ncbi:unnamed protein product [Moneuplotes crassus]|uniref:Neurotransmitter-gated ion-channel ligand-binding domain-containing protein n=1 Tax=Euplotes crassus TaxID=5936 RepID=A0AAD1Y4W7_EUPCR|nr:unnamed protein product [Moneuplotes crassus]
MKLVLILGLICVVQCGVIDDITVNYEGGLPPNYPGQTEVMNHIYVENTNNENESKMIFSLMIDLVSVWTDPQLAYSDTISTKSSINFSDDISKVWKPQIQITNSVRDEDIMRETMTVFKNGTVIYAKRYNLELRCDFDFSTETKEYDCKYIFYPLTYSQAYLKLSLKNYTTNGELKEVSVRIYDQSEDFSGIQLRISPDKKINYYTYTIVVPSILFTLMSYLGFWIDSKSVPARAYLGSLAILVNINALFLLPVVSSVNWMGNFLLGCLMFGVLTMIEVNFSPLNHLVLHLELQHMNCKQSQHKNRGTYCLNINNEDLEPEHDIKVLDQIRKSKNKNPQEKDFELEPSKFDDANHDFSFGKQEQKSEENKEPKDDSDNASHDISPRRDTGNKPMINIGRLTISKESKNPLPPIDEMSLAAENNPEILKKVSIQKANSEQKVTKGLRKEEDFKTPVKPRPKNTVNFDIIPEREGEGEGEGELEAEGEGEQSLNDISMGRALSHTIQKNKINSVRLDRRDTDRSESPVKQDFLPISNTSMKLQSPIQYLEGRVEESKNNMHAEGSTGHKPPIIEKRRKSMIGQMTLQPGKHKDTIAILKKITMRARKNLNSPNKSKDKITKNKDAGGIHKSFLRLKTQIKKNNGAIIKKLKTETKKKIEEIIKIETSTSYRLASHIMNRLDIFCRFWFPIVYMIWFNITIFTYGYNYILFSILSVLIVCVIGGYFFMKIKDLKKKRGLTTCQSIKYYMRCRCLRLDKTLKLT